VTRFLLDTDALIDFSKRREPAFSAILSWIDGDDTVGVCAICVAEFYSGLTGNDAEEWRAFISSLIYWDITPRAAMRAGQDRCAFLRAGRTISVTDSLLASVARAYQAVLVTGNVKDYPMQDIRLFSLLG
jgi:predicted nucleic acid-binding protein